MNYFYTNDEGSSCGPYTAEQMQQLYLNGTLREDSWVIAEGAAEWQSYASLALLETDGRQPDDTAIRCANCGAVNMDDAAFCTGCGSKLDTSSLIAEASPEAKHGFKKHAFISHSSQNRELAQRVCEVLEEFGVNCWIAPRDIDPGEPYDEEIMRGIESSQTFILLLSDAANASPHVKRELMVALRAGHAIYPIRIQEVEPGPKLEYLLEGIHWVDAWTPPIEAHLDRLAQLIVSNDPDAVSASRAAGAKLKGKALWKMRKGTRMVFASVLLVFTIALLATLWEARKWKTGVISGIVNYLTEQVDARFKGLSKPEPTLSENAKREHHATLLAKATEATANHQWQAAVNAYEAALELFDDEKTRSALAQAASERDLDQVMAHKREEYKRLIADAQQAEKSSDFPTAQSIYERAATAAPTDTERLQALEKARNAGEGLAHQKKLEKFNELILRAKEAEDKKDLLGAIDIYTKAEATAPDETTASKARMAKAKIIAYRANLDPKINRTITLSWTSDPKSEKRYPSSDQVLNAMEDVIGEIRLDAIGFETVLQLTFTSPPPEKKSTLLCEFRSDDPVGQMRVGKADGISFSCKVTEIKGESKRDGHLDAITILVTTKR